MVGCSAEGVIGAEREIERSPGIAVFVGEMPNVRLHPFHIPVDDWKPLLSDADHAVAEKYDTWGEKSMYGKKYMGIIRSAFVVDEQGEIAAAFYKVSPKDTVPKVKSALEA